MASVAGIEINEIDLPDFDIFNLNKSEYKKSDFGSGPNISTILKKIPA